MPVAFLLLAGIVRWRARYDFNTRMVEARIRAIGATDRWIGIAELLAAALATSLGITRSDCLWRVDLAGAGGAGPCWESSSLANRATFYTGLPDSHHPRRSPN